MKIKIGNFNFINNEENKLSTSTSLNTYMDYFYLDGKENTLFVRNRYRFDLLENGNEFEKELMKDYTIVDYRLLTRNLINTSLKAISLKEFNDKNYSRYDLYNNISINDIYNLNSNSNFSYYYEDTPILDFDKNRIFFDDIELNLYSEKIENFDELYQKGKFDNVIKNLLIKTEIEHGQAPEFIYSILKIKDFLQNKQTVNIVIDGVNKYKAEARFQNFLELRNNEITLDKWGTNFEKENPNINFSTIKLDDFKGIMFGKTMLEINPKTLQNLREQIAISPEDKLLFKIDELKNNIQSEYIEIRNKYYDMPFDVKKALSEIVSIDVQNQNIESQNKKYPSWYKENEEKLEKIFSKELAIEDILNLETPDDITVESILATFDDEQLYNIFDEVKHKYNKDIDKEPIYEVNIYETKEDYDKGEPFQFNIFSDLEEAKIEMNRVLEFNSFYSGNIINQITGKEEYNTILLQEETSENEEEEEDER